MRIKSNFHDFYDSVMAYGQDQSIFYLRKPVEESLHKVAVFPFLCGSGPWTSSKMPTIEGRIVGFCGKIYPVAEIAVSRTYNIDGRYDPKQMKAFCYTMEAVDAFIQANFRERQLEGYLSKGYNRYWTVTHQGAFAEWFERCAEAKGKYQKVFVEHKTPLFVTESRRFDHVIVFNACLKDVEFYRVMDPYTAFQDLAMYWGGMAQDNRPIPAVSDKDMVTAKGFDKWSFRKEPKK